MTNKSLCLQPISSTSSLIWDLYPGQEPGGYTFYIGNSFLKIMSFLKSVIKLKHLTFHIVSLHMVLPICPGHFLFLSSTMEITCSFRDCSKVTSASSLSPLSTVSGRVNQLSMFQNLSYNIVMFLYVCLLHIKVAQIVC